MGPLLEGAFQSWGCSSVSQVHKSHPYREKFGPLVRGEVAGAIKWRPRRKSYHHRRRVLGAIQHGPASVLTPKPDGAFLAVWKPDAAESGNHSREETDHGHDHAESH
jgi:hypothetical protein